MALAQQLTSGALTGGVDRIAGRPVCVTIHPG
jgi:hypothetical protein